MLRTIWVLAVLVVATIVFALPVAILVPIVPRWGNLAMHSGKLWSRVMLLAVGARVSYEGLEHVRFHLPAVYISNHQSMIDVWALIRILPPATRFATKRELFRIPVFGWVLAAAGFMPIDRTNRAEAIRSLDERASACIRAGGSLALFPEGTRSRDGRLGRFKKGAFHVALKVGVPIVPVAITGSFEVLPPGAFPIRPGPVIVRFEPSIDVAPYLPADHAGLHADVRAAIERGIRAHAPPPEPTAVELRAP